MKMMRVSKKIEAKTKTIVGSEENARSLGMRLEYTKTPTKTAKKCIMHMSITNVKTLPIPFTFMHASKRIFV